MVLTSRRSFFRSVLAAVAAGAVLDVDKLLWLPGQKTIFLPPAPIVIPHGNAFLAGQIVAREALATFENALTFQNAINRKYADLFDRPTPRMIRLQARQPRRVAFA